MGYKENQHTELFETQTQVLRLDGPVSYQLGHLNVGYDNYILNHNGYHLHIYVVLLLMTIQLTLSKKKKKKSFLLKCYQKIL